MKTKLKNLCFALAVLPFFMSCNNNDEPSNGAATIHFDQASPVQINNGTLLVTGSIESRNATTIESIEVFCVYATGSQSNETRIATKNDLSEVSKSRYTFRFTETTPGIQENIGTITGIRIVANVRGGDRSEQTLAVSRGNTQPGDNLSNPKSFTWERIGSNPAVGLDQFGLEWEQNRGGFVIIVRDQATKLVNLTSANWTTIATRAALKSAVDEAASITRYENISTNVGTSYNDYLGIHYEDTYYILHVERAEVQNLTAGTHITITGQYKN